MKTYKVKVNNKEIPVSNMRVSALPFNKVFDGTQRPLSQTEEAYYVSIDMTEKAEMEILVEEEFANYEILNHWTASEVPLYLFIGLEGVGGLA